MPQGAVCGQPCGRPFDEPPPARTRVGGFSLDESTRPMSIPVSSREGAPKRQKTRLVHRSGRVRPASRICDLAFCRRGSAARPLRSVKPMHKTRSVPLRAELSAEPPLTQIPSVAAWRRGTEFRAGKALVDGNAKERRRGRRKRGGGREAGMESGKQRDRSGVRRADPLLLSSPPLLLSSRSGS